MAAPLTDDEILAIMREWRRAQRSGQMRLHWKDGEVYVLDTKVSNVETAYNHAR
jgi:hypothetical protein